MQDTMYTKVFEMCKVQTFRTSDCSNLPVYAIVNSLKTRSQFTCEACVRDPNDDQVFALVHTLLDKEKEFKVLQSDYDNRDGKDNPSEVSSEPGEPRDSKHDLNDQKDKSVKQVINNKPVSKQVINNDSDRPGTVCVFYKQHRRKFGLISRDCPYEHPKLCFRYEWTEPSERM